MREESGQCQGPQLILHGGAGPVDPKGPYMAAATKALRSFGDDLYQALSKGRDPHEVVLAAIKAMESDEHFNAGRGSALQQDGAIRLTAAVMDGSRQRFSGVIGVEGVLHPVLMANALQDKASRVIGPPGTLGLAQRLGLETGVDLRTPRRIQEWENAQSRGCDTVGCVVRGPDGKIWAATSTGGRGFEDPGRQSDAATVAGTYASAVCGVSATGVGEEIIDDALAARIETRVHDGMTLAAASKRAFEEAKLRNRNYGWIALDADRSWALGHTSDGMIYAVYGDGGLLASS